MGAKGYPLEIQRRAGIWYLTSPALRRDYGIIVAFTSRRGGASKPPYQSLNLAFRVGDDPADVIANRSSLCAHLGLDLGSWILAEQVHGTEIAEVERDRGRGAEKAEEAIPSVDGLVTRAEGLTLVLLFADCVPVVVVHPPTKTIAIAHAGWRGTLARIAESLVDRAKLLSNADPGEFVGFIGPAIGPCCYKVDGERREIFRRYFGDIGTDKNSVDLVNLNVDQLVRAGVARESLEVAGICTSCCKDDFYSFRASGGVTGRQAGLVALL